MALRAKYEADFQDFYSAVAQSVTALDSWETKGEAVEKQMDQVAHSLTGAPVIAETKAMTESMDAFGVQTVNTGAIVDAEASGMTSAFASIGTTIAAAFTVQQIIGFVGGVMDAASEIGDLSAKLGISTEAVQRFKFAAEQGGSTIDNVARSIQTMNNKLSEGGKGTIAAVQDLGLDLETLKNSDPAQAFIAIGNAIAEISNPMDQTRLAMELFGKSGVENLQMINAGIEDVSNNIALMTDDQIRRLKAAQDQWKSWGSTITVVGADAINTIIKAGSSWKEFGIAAVETAIPIASVRDQVRPLIDAVSDFDLVSGSASQAASDFGMMVATVPAPLAAVANGLRPVAIEGDRVDMVIRGMNENLHRTTEQLGLVEPKLGTLAQFTRTQAHETESLAGVLQQAAAATDVWNSGLTFTSEVIGELPAQLQSVASAIDQVTASQTAQSGALHTQGERAGGTINTAGITVGGPGMSLEDVFHQYNVRYGGAGSAIGQIGGGPPPDFLTWALNQGLATRNAPAFPAGGIGAAPVTQTINMNGLLGTNDPQTMNLIKSMVGDALMDSMKSGRLLSSA